jgi:uncharacterized protein
MTSVSDNAATMTARPKPAPAPAYESEPLWNGAARHELIIQQCTRCQHLLYPPDIACPQCHSDNLAEKQLSGKGRLYSFTVITRPFHQGFIDDLPYVVGFVELDEQPGLRLITTIVGDQSPDDLVVDMPVEVVFEDREGHTVILFRPTIEDTQ